MPFGSTARSLFGTSNFKAGNVMVRGVAVTGTPGAAQAESSAAVNKVIKSRVAVIIAAPPPSW